MKTFKSSYIIATLVVLVAIHSALRAAELPRGLITLDNSQADNFQISDYDGKHYELKQSRGKWVFVHFWASWCGPCRKEMPIVYALEKQFADKPIDFVLINTAEDEDTIFAFLGSVAPDLHSYMDKEGDITEAWSPRGLPTTFFIDPEGRKRYLALGGRPWDKEEYQRFLQSLFQATH